MPTDNKLADLFHAQGGDCFYCGLPTYMVHAETKLAARERLGITTAKELRRRRASTEHLERKTDGGTLRWGNIVMACNGCNTARGERPVLVHLAIMRTAAQRI